MAPGHFLAQVREMILILSLLSVATASFDLCNNNGLAVSKLVAVPSDEVRPNQLTSFDIDFTIPAGAHLTDGTLEISSQWSFLPAYVNRLPLNTYMRLPMYSGNHTFGHYMFFPIGLWGNAVFVFRLLNITGEELIRARWKVRVV